MSQGAILWYNFGMKNISIICLNENSTLETIALRGALEYFGYTPTVHWLGSISQFQELVSGKVPLDDLIVFSAHGCDEGFYGTDNAVALLSDLKINLKDKTVLSLGCVTGKEHFAQAFMKGGVKNYIAPVSYPEGNSSLIFALTFLWKLQINEDVLQSWQSGQDLLIDKADAFQCYQKTTTGILVNGSQEIQ